MITIEKNVPMPTCTKLVRATLAAMGVGDSFLLGPTTTDSDKSMLYREIRRSVHEFTCRAEAGGTRVWRLE